MNANDLRAKNTVLANTEDKAVIVSARKVRRFWKVVLDISGPIKEQRRHQLNNRDMACLLSAYVFSSLVIG